MHPCPMNLPRLLSWRLSPLFTDAGPIYCTYLVHDASFTKLRFMTLDPLENMDFLVFAIDRETNRILEYNELFSGRVVRSCLISLRRSAADRHSF